MSRAVAGRDRQTDAAARCRRHHCNTLLEPIMGQHGVVHYICPPCELNQAGLCRDCRGPLEITCSANPPFRCPSCRRKHHTKLHKLRYHMDPVHYRAARRRSDRNQSPEDAERRKEYHRQYHRDHPVTYDEFSRVYKRVWQKQHFAKPSVNAAHNKKRRAYAEKRRKAAVLAGKVGHLRKRDRQWLREAGILPIRERKARRQREAVAA